jgi:hypothetical protein
MSKTKHNRDKTLPSIDGCSVQNRAYKDPFTEGYTQQSSVLCLVKQKGNWYKMDARDAYTNTTV